MSISNKFSTNVLTYPIDSYQENQFDDINSEIAEHAQLLLTKFSPTISIDGIDKPSEAQIKTLFNFLKKTKLHQTFALIEQQVCLKGGVVIWLEPNETFTAPMIHYSDRYYFDENNDFVVSELIPYQSNNQNGYVEIIKTFSYRKSSAHPKGFLKLEFGLYTGKDTLTIAIGAFKTQGNGQSLSLEAYNQLELPTKYSTTYVKEAPYFDVFSKYPELEKYFVIFNKDAEKFSDASDFVYSKAYNLLLQRSIYMQAYEQEATKTNVYVLGDFRSKALYSETNSQFSKTPKFPAGIVGPNSKTSTLPEVIQLINSDDENGKMQIDTRSNSVSNYQEQAEYYRKQIYLKANYSYRNGNTAIEQTATEIVENRFGDISTTMYKKAKREADYLELINLMFLIFTNSDSQKISIEFHPNFEVARDKEFEFYSLLYDKGIINHADLVSQLGFDPIDESKVDISRDKLERALLLKQLGVSDKSLNEFLGADLEFIQEVDDSQWDKMFGKYDKDEVADEETDSTEDSNEG